MKYLGKYAVAVFFALSMLVMAGCAAPDKQQTVGAYIDDSTITARVKATILDDAELRVSEINVETFDGVVQLSGFVSSETAINRAVRVTQNVEGVKSVKNDMQLK
ncbi:BON domain-containing protein [Nitrincola iocasae]|uniref:Osmotically-inducible protein Y n=1 Tax=Nitrincola iocasae TaxID=2614693 RepID=A0A5J6LFW0_9GAMM|nr:BON domain-containing protein [Nitrincola iocasae]QEW07510.1 BON domain-containing protein [Nitrincola iocasae]